MPRVLLLLPSCLLLALASASVVGADGVPVTPLPAEAQARPHVGSDARGGAMISYKTASLRLGSVHVDRSGIPDGGFALEPLIPPFLIEANEPLRAVVPSDSQIVFVADRASNSAPALTRLRSSGTPSGSFPVALPMPMRRPASVRGLAGRTLLIAKDSDGVSFWTLRAAIVGPDGGLEFSVELPSLLQFFMADAIDACSDGAGGLLAAVPYYDLASTGSKDIAVFRLAADGSRPWGDLARPLVIATRDQTDVRVAEDGQGGMLLVWTDPRSATRSTDIFAHHVDVNGDRMAGWQFYGSPICDAFGAQSQPRITRDGLGGVWIAWLDQRNELAGDLRYTHLLGNGELAPGFTSTGAVLCEAPGAQAEAAIVGDGAGGFYAVWRDDRSGSGDIYVHHVSATGSIAAGWQANGRALCVAPGVQDQPAIAAVNGARAVIAWRDARSSTARIYSAGINDPSTTDVSYREVPGVRLEAMPGSPGLARVRVALAEPGDAVLELLDVAGRSWSRQFLRGPLPAQELTLGDAPAAGLYFARLCQGGRQVAARITVLR